MADQEIAAESGTHNLYEFPYEDTKDGELARKIGGVGGAVTGAILGSMAGPIGTVGGAVVGAVVGGLGSQKVVEKIERKDVAVEPAEAVAEEQDQ